MSQFKTKIKTVRFWKQFGLGFIAGIITSAASVVFAADVTPLKGRLTTEDVERVKALQASQAALMTRTRHTYARVGNPILRSIKDLPGTDLVVVRTFNTAGELRDYLVSAIGDFSNQQTAWSQVSNDNGSWSRLAELDEIQDPLARGYTEHAIRQQLILKAELKEIEDLISKNGREAVVIRNQSMTVSDLRAKIESDWRSFADAEYGVGRPLPPSPEIEIHRAASVGVTEVTPNVNRRAIFGRNRLGFVMTLVGAATLGNAVMGNKQELRVPSKPTYETNVTPEAKPE